jgi:hypothetical protein
MRHDGQITIIAGIAVHDNLEMHPTKENAVHSVITLFTQSTGMSPTAVVSFKIYRIRHGARRRSGRLNHEITEKRTDALLLWSVTSALPFILSRFYPIP